MCLTEMAPCPSFFLGVWIFGYFVYFISHFVSCQGETGSDQLQAQKQPESGGGTRLLRTWPDLLLVARHVQVAAGGGASGI